MQLRAQLGPAGVADSPDLVWPAEELGHLGQAVAAVPGRYPALAQVASESLNLTPDALFTHGLKALLDGYASLRR